jgi:hypothetical protein
LFNAVIALISLKTRLVMAMGLDYVGQLSFLSVLVPVLNRLRRRKKAKAGLRFGMGPKTSQIGFAIGSKKSHEAGY